GGSGAGFHSFPAGSELLPPAAAGEQSDGGGRAGAGRAPPRPGPGFDGDGPCGLCRGSGSVCAQKGPAGIPERCGLPHLRFSPALHRAAALPVALQCPEVYPRRRRGDRGAEIHQPMGPPVRVRHRLRYPGGPDPLPVRPLPSRRCDGAPAPRPGPGTAYLPAHRRAPRRHHDCRVPAGAGVPLHPVVAGPAMRDCGRVGREVRLQRRL
ncbi:SMI1/KNR4 family protein, partial [Dysosmobacter welbionis]